MEKKNKLTALEEYTRKVYTIILILIPSACLIAGLTYTLEKAIGWLPINWITLLLFDASCVLYLMIGIFFIKTGITPDGEVLEGKLKAAKIFICIIMAIQYNFILYMVPLENFWAFLFFFVTLGAFFLDHIMVAAINIEIFVSLIVSWFLKGDVTLPARDDLFLPAMLNKVICIVLSMASIYLITFFVNHFLVNAKKDEMEKNDEKVQEVLNSVASISEKLAKAGNALADISQSEIASAEELSATSETLFSNNNELGRKSDDSIDNLNELQKWEGVVSTQVGRVESSSKELLDKSRENEDRMQSLKRINVEVSESMENTNHVADRLSEAVKEIDVALKVISDISSSTSLLALNASIEAARAGEAGKGFAVVAQSVSNLAGDTQESLGQVRTVIEKIQQNVAEMTAIVNDNAEKLAKQNEYFDSVFSGIQEMIGILRISIEDITEMGEAHDKQSVVIRNTVEINQVIAERIKQENTEFANINTMVENNANDIEQMTAQVNALNHMVEEINRHFAQE